MFREDYLHHSITHHSQHHYIAITSPPHQHQSIDSPTYDPQLKRPPDPSLEASLFMYHELGIPSPALEAHSSLAFSRQHSKRFISIPYHPAMGRWWLPVLSSLPVSKSVKLCSFHIRSRLGKEKGKDGWMDGIYVFYGSLLQLYNTMLGRVSNRKMKIQYRNEMR